MWTPGVFITVSLAANCIIPLNTDERTKGCFQPSDASGDGTFVCDITASWMHHVGGSSDWYPATPPKGSGIHEYVAYKGTAPCAENGECDGCVSSAGDAICSVKIDPDDCSVDFVEDIIRKNKASKFMTNGGAIWQFVSSLFVCIVMSSTF